MTNRSGNSYDVIVIGAGHNGLTAAALLAKRGRRVIVVEQLDTVGGLAASEEFHPGYRSPGLLHDSSGVRHELIASLNLERHGLRVEREPPSLVAPQRDGGGLVLHHDPERAASEIAAFSKRDVDRYYEYRAFVDRIRGFVNGIFDEAPPDLSALNARNVLPLLGKGIGFRRLGKSDMVELFRIIPMSVADWLDEWFETDLLKALLVAPALRGSFVGPRSPGSALGLLLWECRKGPVPVGGPGALVVALEKAAGAAGVEVRTGAKVSAINVTGGRVDGVTLEGGEKIDGSVVAASCDPKTTFLGLLTGSAISEKFQHRIEVFRMNGTTAKVDIALGNLLDFGGEEGHHGVWVRTGDNLNELEQAFDAAKYHQCSESPVLDIHVPPVEPGGLSPEDGQTLSVLVQYTPRDLRDGWGDEQRKALGNWVVDGLSRFYPGLKDSMTGLRVLTPADIEERFGMTGGHIYHGDHGIDQLFVRPSPECARHGTPIEGLYLCGSGSFPGGGITCAPGALGARAILKYS